MAIYYHFSVNELQLSLALKEPLHKITMELTKESLNLREVS